MKRGLLSPKWIAFHILIIVSVIAMINLGMWQLQRLDERKDFNAEVRAHSRTAVQPLSDLLQKNDDYSQLEWYPVRVTGEYIADREITIVNRSQDGAAGRNSVVPMITDHGDIVLINRGFVPLSIDIPPPPTGTVTVIGFARAAQKRSAVGAVDSERPGTTEFQRLDIPLIERVLDLDVAPMYVQRLESDPPEGQWPARVANPPLDEGPHLSYAGQWFFFTAVALIGWIVVIVRQRKKRPASIATTTGDAPSQTSV
jgi:cytochrome oxidase assembly protein ShyY1